VTRIPMSYASVYVIPFIAILSAIVTYLFVRKTSSMLKETDKYERESNDVLVNDVVKSNLYPQIIFSVLASILVLSIGVANITNSVVFLALEIFVAIIVVLLTSTFILPGFYAKNFVRKVKRNKQKEVNN